MSADLCLLVVAKAPVAGQAKTRLCPPASPAQAADIAAAALLDTLAAVAGVPRATVVVALTGALDSASQRDRLAEALAGLVVLPQRGTGFAERLSNAHADVAACCPGRPVLQIGMDTPQVTPELLADTAALLATAPAVLGPATDGGWWALGLRDPGQAAVLREVPMSRPDTAGHTLAALRRAGLVTATGAKLSDVDTMAAAREVAAGLPHSRFAAAVARVGAAAGVGVPVAPGAVR
ncbi:TIGR04282 family arsenosugar biosynthesis glycosyltransferase [Goodfellowiella coeruleoviolacea]|uniref:Glycosyltransferase involved in cell wall biogenesis n=1 Tax=Goodfellowiella coeruleoviolacea TaxID=334858 RepID=A0AAE3KHU3_9PSEU|nr:DUF2064 domain-containing protein [Goodfellowiella coeruleoviolacea]MCP2167227.1 hypothetical protein [Goodfellowiella coeruleoviolacea]